MPTTRNDQPRAAVYRWFAFTGRLLYVGCSVDPDRRWQDLQQTESWAHLAAWRTVEWYGSVSAGREAERAAIKTEDPLFNLQGLRGGNGKVIVKRAFDLPDGSSLPCWRVNGRWLIGHEAVSVLHLHTSGWRQVGPGIFERPIGLGLGGMAGEDLDVIRRAA